MLQNRNGCQFGISGTSLLKVSYFQKDFLKFSFALKNEQKYFCISVALASKKMSNQKNKGTLYQ